MKITIIKNALLLFCLLSVLAGCAPHSAAPVTSRPEPPSDRIDYHVVSTGETLFAIAWSYELDYQKLARANSISSPFTIYAGQRLNLDLSKVEKSQTVLRKSSSHSSQIKVATKTKPEKSVTSSNKTVTKAAVAPRPTASRVTLPKTWKWRWPTQGRVARHYDSNKVFKGIYIHAGKGSAVQAAAPGVVVYAGNGLRGYGRLIIVKHSDVYLSAYAQNRRILVKEGDAITTGQKIAEIGGDMEDPDRLYFEIRRDGKSIDPLRVLPRTK